MLRPSVYGGIAAIDDTRFRFALISAASKVGESGSTTGVCGLPEYDRCLLGSVGRILPGLGVYCDVLGFNSESCWEALRLGDSNVDVLPSKC